MLVPTSSALIISQDPKDASLNTIKIDFAMMSFVNSTKDNYTQCPGCKALLTIEDKKDISNSPDQNGNFIWNCRFCKMQNQNQALYFVSSNFKHCLQKNVSTKMVPPIILFLIDISGSMTSSIFTDLWVKGQQNSQKSSSVLTAQIKRIIQESVMRKSQARQLAQVQKSFGNNNQAVQSFQHFSKLSFLFSIIEYHLKTLRNKKQKGQFRVGFVFFSDSLIVLKGAKQKSIPMYIDQSEKFGQQYPFRKQSLDFNSYGQLYQKGKTYDRYFGDSKFNNFDVSKLSVQYLKTGGRTALGPALAFAAGVVSQHDQGSKVILVTDSLPNYGILSSKQSTVHYNKISQVFKQNNSTIGVFRLINNQFQNLKSDCEFQNFIKSNQQNIKLIQISLKPSVTQQVLQNTIKSLRNLIGHQSVGHSYNLTILTENKKITLNKFKYDNIDYRNLRFITSQSKNWIQVNIDKNQLKQNDLLFLNMTQLIIQYDDVFTKQKCLFMSYVQQRLIKPSVDKKSTFYVSQDGLSQQQRTQTTNQCLQNVNIQNIQTLIDLQSMKRFEEERQDFLFSKKTFRNQLKNIIIRLSDNVQLTSINCRNVNDYTFLHNQVIMSGYDQYLQSSRSTEVRAGLNQVTQQYYETL